MYLIEFERPLSGKAAVQILAISIAGEMFIDLFGQVFESLRHLNGITLC
jgi:hypothetical protein